MTQHDSTYDWKASLHTCRAFSGRQEPVRMCPCAFTSTASPDDRQQSHPRKHTNIHAHAIKKQRGIQPRSVIGVCTKILTRSMQQILDHTADVRSIDGANRGCHAQIPNLFGSDHDIRRCEDANDNQRISGKFE
jgi:hypothetical protein